ncbi:MAG: DUF1294 domain-containing protein [Methanoregula sp.]|jgi:uncharacterized membrane protein YsdA (DUF1294 family)
MIQFSNILAAVMLYLVVNAVVFSLYAADKRRACNNDWRIPERVLLVSALIGPFGAWAGMQIFHHKTRKVLFYLVPVFLILHIAAIFYLAVRLLNIIS